MKLNSLTAIAAITVLTLSSCSTRLMDFTIISSKSTSIAFDKSQGKQVKESDLGFLGIGANVEDALDKALESAGPGYDVLIDGVVKLEDYFLVIGYKVEGVAVKSAEIKASLGVEGYKKWCKENNVFDPSRAELIEE